MRLFVTRFLGAITFAASVGVFAPQAHAVFLSDLIGPPPTTLSSSSVPPQVPYTIIGSNWGYTATGNMPASNAVTVTGTPDGHGNAGFQFQGAFHDNPGGGNSDALITYTVTLSAADIARGLVFTDVHLDSDVTVVNGSTTNIGSISIVETVRDAATNNVVATLQNFDIWTAAGESTVRSADILLDPTKHFTSLIISKDILASSDSANALPQVSHIDQAYSVPEPSSLALIGLGTVGGLMGRAMRRRKARASAPAA